MKKKQRRKPLKVYVVAAERLDRLFITATSKREALRMAREGDGGELEAGDQWNYSGIISWGYIEKVAQGGK